MPKFITRRGQESRRRILDAARPLFHRQGISATSVDVILEQAGMGKSQFYHYFPTKEALVVEVVDLQMREILEFLEPHTQSIESLDDMERWFQAYGQLAQQHHELLGCPVGIIAAESAPESEPVRRRLIAALKLWTEAFTEALRRLQSNGVLNAEFEPERAAEFIGATIQGALLVGRVFQSPVPLANAARHLRRYLESYTS